MRVDGPYLSWRLTRVKRGGANSGAVGLDMVCRNQQSKVMEKWRRGRLENLRLGMKLDSIPLDTTWFVCLIQ